MKYRKILGPSQFAAVVGLDPYQTVSQLQEEIEQGYTPTSCYATQFGCNNEATARYYYQKLYHVVVDKAPFVMDEKNPRIGGVADGLLGTESGLEIKCHVREDNLLMQLPIKYLMQIVGYMHLYKRPNWVLMSCVFGPTHQLTKYVIHEISWNMVFPSETPDSTCTLRDKWSGEWYPQIVSFVNTVQWKEPI